MPAITWRCLPFDALLPHTLYALLRLRSEVFVVEQNCVFQDMDGLDARCLHVLGERPGPDGQPLLVASTRLVPPGLAYAEASIGRVVTSPAARADRLGHPLMAESLRLLFSLWGAQPVRIGAQAHLQAFYRQHGFEVVGEAYVEDGIDHVEMLCPTLSTL
jgi:ElaA protein